MKRADFLKKVSLATMALSAGSSMVYARGLTLNKDKTNSEIANTDLAVISPALQNKIDALIIWMNGNGWTGYMNSLVVGLNCNYDLKSMVLEINSADLQKLKLISGFEDFGGTKWIEPGFPAMSLLYHVLANPRVRRDNNKSYGYPQLEQIDLLEDYIFGLLTWDNYKSQYEIENDNNLILAVFAYEYRTAFKTPHHQCADLVYSRTGIGRIGTKEIRYDSLNRCYTNNPTGDDNDKSIAVTPARFGLFVAKKVQYNADHPQVIGMKMYADKKDDTKYLHNVDTNSYLLPVRKLFNDDTLIHSSPIEFNDIHLSLKLFMLTGKEFLKRDSGTLINKTLKNSSCLISSQPNLLIRPVKDQTDNYVTQHFPKAKGYNRYFTTYYETTIYKNPEYIEVADPTNSVRIPNTYLHFRETPMYANLSHELADKKIAAIPKNGNFENKIDGAIDAPLFEDQICDGWVGASIAGPVGTPLSNIIDRGILKAFSIITAPDFFPQADEFDLQEFDVAPGKATTTIFFEGGIASLANCIIPPNPVVYSGDKMEASNLNPKETYTTVISKFRKKLNDQFSSPDDEKGYFFSSYLPDMCSAVFSPGWDITFAGTNKNTNIFLSTKGLGSPFVEDMKLCAAMNGMWPVASPDAARTYQGSVINGGRYKRNPTAIPLMDSEIGFNELSPACKNNLIKPSTGWDGEQGPFLELFQNNYNPTLNTWYVNFTDLGRADYVENAIHEYFDMSVLRTRTSKELNFRTRCLKRCLDKLGQSEYPDGLNDLWLVSAENVNWQNPAVGYGIPTELVKGGTSWATIAQDGITGDGFLYVFASYKPDLKTYQIYWAGNKEDTKRRRVVCDYIYVCQVSESMVKYCKIETQSAGPFDKPLNWIK